MDVATESNVKSKSIRSLPSVEDRAFLPAALEIIETPASPKAVALMLSICAFAAVALAWSWFGHLDIYGKVTSINVKEGQVVEAGQVLVMLDDSDVRAQIASDDQAIIAAKAEALRRAAAVGSLGSDASIEEKRIDWPAEIPQSVRTRENLVLTGDLKELQSTLENLSAQKLERQAAVQQLESSIAAEKYLQETLDERVVLKQALVDKAVGTRTSLLDAVQSVRQGQAQMAGDVGKRDQAIAAVASLDTERIKAIETFLSENTRKRAEALRLVDEKTADRMKAEVRLDRLSLRSPVGGVVQALAITTIGQVVEPGKELMRIVPRDAPIEIQAYISNDDIGFVSPDQEAFVKVDAFPFSRYGTLRAKVVSVAHDAIPAETANKSLSDATQRAGGAAPSVSQSATPMTDLVFEAHLVPEATNLRVNDQIVGLSPGMTVTVEIRTGSRRVLEFLFSPLLEIKGKAMSER
jgi:hemolysin D